MRIAFAYIDVLPDVAPMYRTLAEGLARNIWGVFEQKPIHITNEKTAPIKGCDVLRVDIDEPPMTWRLLAHQYAHGIDDEILFTEPDVRFRENILHCFQQSFDVAFTDREEETIYGGEKTTEVAPYTQGSTFSRSAEFWKDCADYCKTLDRKKQLWFGDMLAIAHVVRGDKYNVGIFPASKLNHIPKSRADTGYPVVHYKGKRKAWLFPEEMKFVSGAWLPGDETDSVMLGSGIQYQKQKLDAAMEYVKSHRTAVDVGAHCGLWSAQMVRRFEKVVAFEPLERHWECFTKNVTCELHKVVLGDHEGTCGMKVAASSGRSSVSGEGSYPMTTLDSYDLQEVDFIKIDVEGFEAQVIIGAEQTIKKHKPVIIVEQKFNTDGLGVLKTFGYQVKREMAGDYIMVLE